MDNIISTVHTIASYFLSYESIIVDMIPKFDLVDIMIQLTLVVTHDFTKINVIECKDEYF